MLNNSSVSQLSFEVVENLSADDLRVVCTKNPASTRTSFVISQNMAGADMDVVMDVFDFSGRQLYKRSLTGVTTSNDVSVIDWDLCLSGGSRLQTGVYLCRFTVGGGASKTVKLIVLKQ